MVQRKFGGFLHSICETNLRFFHVPVPRSKQAPLDHRWLQDGHCWHVWPSGPPYCTKFRPSQVTLQFSQGSSQKFQKSSKMEPFCCSQWAHKSTLWAYERHRPRTSYFQNCFLANFGLRQAQRNPCLGYKQVSNLGQWEKVALFPSSDFIAKSQLAREGSQSVSPVTIPALTNIVDRQFKNTGPCVPCGPWGTIWTKPKT